MAAQLVVVVVAIPFDGGFLDDAVHALDLAIGPGGVDFCQAVVDVMFTAHPIEDVLKGAGVLLAIGELDAVVCEDGVDLVREPFDQVSQELS